MPTSSEEPTIFQLYLRPIAQDKINTWHLFQARNLCIDGSYFYERTITMWNEHNMRTILMTYQKNHRLMHLSIPIRETSIGSTKWLTKRQSSVQRIGDCRMLRLQWNIYTAPLLSEFKDHLDRGISKTPLSGRGWIQGKGVFWTQQDSYAYELTVVTVLARPNPGMEKFKCPS